MRAAEVASATNGQDKYRTWVPNHFPILLKLLHTGSFLIVPFTQLDFVLLVSFIKLSILSWIRASCNPLWIGLRKIEATCVTNTNWSSTGHKNLQISKKIVSKKSKVTCSPHFFLSPLSISAYMHPKIVYRDILYITGMHFARPAAAPGKLTAQLMAT